MSYLIGMFIASKGYKENTLLLFHITSTTFRPFLFMFPLFLALWYDQVSGNWWLEVGDGYAQVGYWPSRIFSGLKGLATDVEWGGEAYSPPGQPSPPMRSGFSPVNDTYYDAYCRVLTTINDDHDPDDAENTEEFADDTNLYKVHDWGNVGSFRRLMSYGGAGIS